MRYSPRRARRSLRSMRSRAIHLAIHHERALQQRVQHFGYGHDRVGKGQGRDRITIL